MGCVAHEWPATNVIGPYFNTCCHNEIVIRINISKLQNRICRICLISVTELDNCANALTTDNPNNLMKISDGTTHSSL